MQVRSTVMAGAITVQGIRTLVSQGSYKSIFILMKMHERTRIFSCACIMRGNTKYYPELRALARLLTYVCVGVCLIRASAS